MGFAEVAPGEQAFTDRDVEALQTVVALRDSGIIDQDTLLVLARSMGQGMAALTEAQVDVFRDLADGMTVEQATASAGHAAAAATKDGHPVKAVGFVDLVDFTKSSQRWTASTLERMLERFEAETALRVTDYGGRVVKTLGDAVLYVTDDAGTAVEVALETVEAHNEDAELPDVRAGVALGPVLVRLGDVFGQPVNVASRLTDQARPRTVLVDNTLAQVLDADPAFETRRLRRRSVRGYRSLTPHVLRRSAGAHR